MNHDELLEVLQKKSGLRRQVETKMDNLDESSETSTKLDVLRFHDKIKAEEKLIKKLL